MSSRVRRSGNHTPPSLAQPSAPMLLLLLQTKDAGAPLLPAGGVTPPDPVQYGTSECRKVASVHQVIQSLGMYWKFSCVSHWYSFCPGFSVKYGVPVAAVAPLMGGSSARYRPGLFMNPPPMVTA